MKFSAAEYFSIAVAAIFVQNLVLVYLLPSNVFFRALKSPVSGMKYGAVVTIATTVSSAFGWLINRFVLKVYGLAYLAPLAFVLILVLLTVAAELLLKRYAPGTRRRLGTLVPVSAFNCAVLGLLVIDVQLNTRGIMGTIFYGFCAGVGFTFALFIMANAMERAGYSTPPKAFKGLPIAFVTASLVALAFMGFTNLRVPF